MSAQAVTAGASLVDAAYQQIRQRTLDNLWPPGHRALEQEVALALGMSRTPVREALMRLRNEGLVEVIPRHGMRVLPVSPAEMREIYQILTALECMAGELLARRRPTDAALKPLVAATKAMDKALKADDLDAWAAADERFHTHLIERAGNRQLQATLLNYCGRAHCARMFALRLRPKPVISTREQIDLVAHLRAGDVEGVVQGIRAHRARATVELFAIFERYRLQHLRVRTPHDTQDCFRCLRPARRWRRGGSNRRHGAPDRAGPAGFALPLPVPRASRHRAALPGQRPGPASGHTRGRAPDRRRLFRRRGLARDPLPGWRRDRAGPFRSPAAARARRRIVTRACAPEGSAPPCGGPGTAY